MKWRGRRRSKNVEDRRGQSSRGGLPGGLRIPTRLPGGRAGAGGGLGFIALIVIALLLGVDPTLLLQGGPGEQVSLPGQQSAPRQPLSTEQRELGEFVEVILADTEETWHGLFRGMNRQYVEPTLVLFSGSTPSACGMGQAAMGPFYCPADQQVYIDLSFYDDLKSRFAAPGDFAQAYVIAHEIGHHVQTLLGISQQVHSERRRLSQTEGNKLSVRQELQADCFAGVWAYHAKTARDLLEAGDVEEGLTAASAIGDDRLQKQSRGYVTPESFTHGSSKQRVKWFKKGLASGSLDACNTFEVAQP